MITYTKEAQDSYIKRIEELQHKLSEIPANLLGFENTHWLIHTALNDLSKVVEKEHQ